MAITKLAKNVHQYPYTTQNATSLKTQADAVIDILDRTDGSASQALSGAGAINLTTAVTRFTSTGAGNALTLADSTVVGQEKTIIHAVKGSSGTGVLTAGSALHLGDSIATITLTNVRANVKLKWNGAAWDVIGYTDVTFG